MVKEASRSSEKRENIIAGAVGAFLGSLLGVVCVVLVGQLGYVVSLSGLVMAVCAIKGYELLGGRLSKKGCIIACLIILGMTYFAHQLSCAITISQEIGLDIFQSFRTISFFLEMDVLDAKAYWGNLFMLYGFTLLGPFPPSLSPSAAPAQTRCCQAATRPRISGRALWSCTSPRANGCAPSSWPLFPPCCCPLWSCCALP